MGDFGENIFNFDNDEWWLDDNEVDEILRELVHNEEEEAEDSGYESQDEVEQAEVEEEEAEVEAEVQERDEEEEEEDNADAGAAVAAAAAAAGDILYEQPIPADIDSDAETIEYIFDQPQQDPDYEVSSSSSSDDDDDNNEEDEYESCVARENELHRTIATRRQFYSRVRVLCSQSRTAELEDLNRELIEVRENRRRLQNYGHRRRRRHHPYIDAPQRYRDLCYGCGKRFWCERIRKWVRCADCGLWLCPDCSYEPQHHCREDPF